ncbi:MAG: cryptochrome/photolyase family protein [Cyanobacteria bacterium P01_C01_bin.89]
MSSSKTSPKNTSKRKKSTSKDSSAQKKSDDVLREEISNQELDDASVKTGIWVLGDQLWAQQAALASQESRRDKTPVIAIESTNWISQRRYHRQKLVLVWSAMRSFIGELKDAGWLATLAEAENFSEALIPWIREQKIERLLVMAPADRPFLKVIESLDLPCELSILPNNQFLWTEEELLDWFSGRKRLLMEDFYRFSRKKWQILMDPDNPKDPLGDQWNFDKDNRKPPKKNLDPPEPKTFEPNANVQAVIDKINGLDCPLFGDIESFNWATTRNQALEVLDAFLETRLRKFGPYQDAMVTGEDTMWHALLSPYINIGLLHPLDVIQKIEEAYKQDSDIPLNSVEGVIRQILGWREYIRGIYCHALENVDENYPESNWFDHQQPLPQWFWTGETKMNCLSTVVNQVQRTGYAHHIQRLMILGNFSLIAGFNPQEVEDWFHSVFIDSYDWVMQPNVLGMGIFADGGLMASKPYAASANYVNKMSDYCKGCQYKPKEKVGEKACPFNFFYWDFLSRHEDKLRSQGRMGLVLKHVEKMDAGNLKEIQSLAKNWHEDVANAH